jgi:hypothetical protein
MTVTRAVSCLLSAALFCVLGCTTSKPTPNALAGWRTAWKEQPDQAVERDFQQYVQSLPPEEKMASKPGSYLEDGTGQHALVLEVAVKGTWCITSSFTTKTIGG